MGKKHKKHHKSEKRSHEEEEHIEHDKPLKMVIKFGSPEKDSAAAAPTPPERTHEEKERRHEEKKHKHKKKKKKKSSEKDKKDKSKHRHHHHHHHREHQDKTEERQQENLQVDVEDEQAVEVKPRPEKHERVEDDADDANEERPSKRQALSPAQDLYDRRMREPRTCTVEKHHEDPLRECLEYLQKILQRKDVNGFFSFPVNDIIAPGYSSIISHPMDFSTMKSKIENAEYGTVGEYKRDFKVMCDNAMTYNRPDTIYYKAANKLWDIGKKAMSKERLINMRRTLTFMQNIPMDQITVDEDGEEMKPPPPPKPKVEKKAKTNSYTCEAVQDDLSPKEILAQAKAAAKDAADRLTLRCPDSKLGFLRRQKDGTTSLTILNPENDGIVSEKERVISLGEVVGKLNSGTGSIAGFKEDKRNKITPVNYLQYGPFSSYAPVYDSSFANLSKEESDILLSAYGSETGTQYAKSLEHFVSDCGDYTVKMVDNLLDLLTGGEHSKTQKALDEMHKQQKERADRDKENTDSGKQNQDAGSLQDTEKAKDEKSDSGTDANKQSNSKKDEDVNVDFDKLRSLSDLGIDMSFLDAFEKQSQVETQLNTTSELLQNLRETQEKRLSQRVPSHLAHVQGPSTQEMQLADKVTKELTKLTEQFPPSAVTNEKSVRDAMGITLHPVESEIVPEPQSCDQSQPEPEPIIDGLINPETGLMEPCEDMDTEEQTET